MPRATGRGVNGSPGLRKKRRPAVCAPSNAPGASPAASTSSQPGRAATSDDEDRPVQLVVEVPVVGVAGEFHRDRVVDGHADAVAVALHEDVLLVERDPELAGAREKLLLDILRRLLAGRETR